MEHLTFVYISDFFRSSFYFTFPRWFEPYDNITRDNLSKIVRTFDVANSSRNIFSNKMQFKGNLENGASVPVSFLVVRDQKNLVLSKMKVCEQVFNFFLLPCNITVTHPKLMRLYSALFLLRYPLQDGRSKHVRSCQLLF